MNHQSVISQMAVLMLLMLLSAACGTAAPAPTPVPPTSTPLPPTLTPLPPTPTPLPTATPTQSPVEADRVPAPRGYTSMAYDVESDRVILFGGSTGDIFEDTANYNGATWAYDSAGNIWTQMKPASGPGRRSASELAYDAESDRVILFGGVYNNLPLGDAWTYDYNTNTWTEMAAKGPYGYVGPRMAYDAESDRIILFGGFTLDGRLRNTTWAYDFNTDTWTLMKPSTSPPGRNYQAMAYDARADRVITWGALDFAGLPIDESIWSYDFNANTWQEIKPGGGPHPSGRDYPAMAYDAESDRMVLFGGIPIGDETWAYDYKTNTWTKLEPVTNPGRLSRHVMVYSTTEDRVVLFGGQMGFSDFYYTGKTWTYDFNTNTWTDVTPNP